MGTLFFHKFLILFSFLAPQILLAQTNVLQIKEPRIEKSFWSGKAEISGKNTYDKKNSINGYSAEADLKVFRMFSKSWGLATGAVIAHESRKNEESLTTLDQASIGFINVSTVLDLQWKSIVTYNFLLQEEVRNDKSSEGFLGADIRTHLPLGLWGKARLRLKHYEYFPFSDKGSANIRQSKLEYSPAYHNGPISFGLKNHMTHVWQQAKETDTVEVAPFVKYADDMWEPLIKVSYRPVDKSEDFKIAEGWDQKPYYSVELEMNF